MTTATRGSINNMKEILNDRIYMNYPLAPLTSLKIGGQAEIFAIIHDLHELQKIMMLADSYGMKARTLGKGTNLVIQNGLLKGIIIHLEGKFREIKRNKDRIEMGGGCPLSLLLKEAIAYNLGGTEVLAGIPGTLGGAATMNAGTKMGSLGDLIEDADILRGGKIETWNVEKMGFSYRESAIGNGKILLGARLKLNPGVDVKASIKKTLQKRWSMQPYRERSAGCVFRNPEGMSAGKLIDEAGLKGYRIGQIEISKRHANFFINLGEGTFDDFIRLMDIVRKKVIKEFGVELRPEVKIWMNEDEK
ncbi:MAG: UDP-N-acetylmuramate dehydrogenase [bacterium]